MISKTLRQAPGDKEPGQRAPPLSPDQISLNEVYTTFQGECSFAGTPTLFIRTSHCPLRCVWCDSQYTFKEGTPTKVLDVVQQAEASGLEHVCVTGGEPLAQPQTFDLVKRLALKGFTIEIETSGSEDISPFNVFAETLRRNITVNLDVKCPGSAMSNFNRWENFAHLRPHDQVKFVIADRADYEYARDMLAERRPLAPAWFHPAWKKLDPANLAAWMKEDRYPARLGVQIHKYIWGDVRGV